MKQKVKCQYQHRKESIIIINVSFSSNTNPFDVYFFVLKFLNSLTVASLTVSQQYLVAKLIQCTTNILLLIDFPSAAASLSATKLGLFALSVYIIKFYQQYNENATGRLHRDFSAIKSDPRQFVFPFAGIKQAIKSTLRCMTNHKPDTIEMDTHQD